MVIWDLVFWCKMCIRDRYKDVKDLSVVAKFELTDNRQQTTDNREQGAGEGGKTYILAWTTTPWTLPGNVALAIHRDTVYCEIKNEKLKIKNEEELSLIHISDALRCLETALARRDAFIRKGSLSSDG